MTAHIHAENMKLYAQDAAETDKPWERWEFRNHSTDAWLSGYAIDWTAKEYRRKPRTHKVNGFDVPEPMRDAPAGGVKYWIAEPCNEEWAEKYWWHDDSNDRRWLQRGLVHATKEAAIANAKAMLGMQP